VLDRYGRRLKTEIVAPDGAGLAARVGR
jgi:hypothetical protein